MTRTIWRCYYGQCIFFFCPNSTPSHGLWCLSPPFLSGCASLGISQNTVDHSSSGLSMIVAFDHPVPSLRPHAVHHPPRPKPCWFIGNENPGWQTMVKIWRMEKNLRYVSPYLIILVLKVPGTDLAHKGDIVHITVMGQPAVILVLSKLPLTF